MDEEIQKPEPKISDVEIILIGIFYLGLDAIDFIPAAGDITDVIAAPMGFYYWMKGLNGTAFLASEAIEAIPGAQELPFVRTITWGINIWLDRHPKLQATFATVEAIGGGLDALEGGEGVPGASGAAEGISNSESLASETAGGAATSEGERRVVTDEEGSAGKTTVGEGGRPSDENTERDLTENKRASEREPKDADATVDTPQPEHDSQNIDDDDIATPKAMRDPIAVEKEEQLGNVVPITQKSSSDQLNDRLKRIREQQQKGRPQSINPAYEDRAA